VSAKARRRRSISLKLERSPRPLTDTGGGKFAARWAR
jgi:hypothetical protein